MRYKHKSVVSLLVFVLLVASVLFGSVLAANKNIKEITSDRLECFDEDRDGFTSLKCGGLDCNDNSSVINPDAKEICGNEIDENCDNIDDICVENDLKFIEVEYKGDLRINEEVEFNVYYESTLEENELIIYIDNEILKFNGSNYTNFNYVFKEKGNYDVEFVLDPDNEILEVDEENNNYILTLEINDIQFCDFRNEITGCVVCSCNSGEACNIFGECFELNDQSPIIPSGFRDVSFYPDDSVNYLFFQGKRFVEIFDTNKRYLHNDPTGSLNLITDDFGNEVESITHLPFGMFNRNSANVNYYAGKKQDDSGLYYFGGRYYDPRLGRFIQTDPVYDDALTPYKYAHNNPFSFNDPDGREEKDVRDNKIVSRKYGPYSYIREGPGSKGYPLSVNGAPSKHPYGIGASAGKVIWDHYLIIKEVLSNEANLEIEQENSLDGRFKIGNTALANVGGTAESPVMERARQAFESVGPISLEEAERWPTYKTDYEVVKDSFFIIEVGGDIYVSEKGENGIMVGQLVKMDVATRNAYNSMLLRRNILTYKPVIYDTSKVGDENKVNAPDATSVRIEVGEQLVKND